MREIIVTAANCGQRLDRFLLKHLDRAPRSFVQKMIRKRGVKLNDTKAAGNETVREGDTVRIFLSDEVIAGLTAGKCVNPDAGSLDIIYEDGNVLIVNKPPGVLSQPDSAEIRDSVADRAALYLPPVCTPAVANRLDRNTSGCVAVGATNAALAWLNRAFAEGDCEKMYLVLAAGDVREPFAVRVYLRKNSHKVAEVYAQPTDGAKYAVTEFEPMAAFRGCTLLRARPGTGRFHQIRASLKFAGYAVVGDAKYGDPRVNTDFRRAFGVTSQLLHCESLTFTREDGLLGYLEGRKFRAELPEGFAGILQKYGVRV